METGTVTHKKIERLKQLLPGRRNMLIILQDYPDPDAVAAAAALREVVKHITEISVSIASGGAVGRAENRALVRYMGMNLLTLARLDPQQYDLVAMVDTQPGTGNNALLEPLLPHIVLDHHPIRPVTRRCAFYDIRSRYGATSSILWEYLTDLGIEPDPPLATALLYGIRSDTDDLGRRSCSADHAAYLYLYAHANLRMLSRIQDAPLPTEYFQSFFFALQHARRYGPCMICGMGEVSHPDLISEIADFLLRDEQSSWVLCYGGFHGRLLLSLRTQDTEADAGRLMHRLILHKGTGGGHHSMAGGQVILKEGTPQEVAKIEKLLLQRLRRYLGFRNEAPVALIP